MYFSGCISCRKNLHKEFNSIQFCPIKVICPKIRPDKVSEHKTKKLTIRHLKKLFVFASAGGKKGGKISLADSSSVHSYKEKKTMISN